MRNPSLLILSMVLGTAHSQNQPTSQPSTQPSTQPSGQPSSIPSGMPSAQPSSQPSGQPSSIPSGMPSAQPSSMPSGQPSSIPSGMPSAQPSSMPSGQPSAQPSGQPSGQPSSIPSEKPSAQPSSVPSGQPSSIPSEKPSAQPSSVPSGQPSSIPSEKPSSQPSSVPSLQPSSMPSMQPTSQPSEQPSAQPSCTPSAAPSNPEKTFLFYPDWSSGGEGCKNDGKEPGYMSASPSYYMSTTLDKCCSTYFGWNFATCSGNLPGICARSLYYPDWAGKNEGCLNDGNEPKYIRDNYMYYLFSKLEDCCKTHYSWNYFSCMGSKGLQNKELFYPDWKGQGKSCKNGGGQPTYMNNAPDVWLHPTLAACCADYYEWNKDECMGSSTSVGSGSVSTAVTVAGNQKYYPDWSRNDHVCRNDGKQLPYMTNNQALWMYDKLEDCCKARFKWNYSACIATGSTPSATPASASTPTNPLYYPNVFYPDWQDRSVCSNDGKQPTYMTNSPTIWMYVTLEKCCKERFPAKYDSCVGSTSSSGTSNSGTSNSGTNKYYVNYQNHSCVKDCVGPAPCGGLAKSFEIKYDTKTSCCQQRLWWKDGCLTN